MKLVFLTDQDDSTMLVRCASQAEAEDLGRSAIYSDGGVSAWLVPEVEIVGPAVADVIYLLREGCDLSEVEDRLSERQEEEA